MRHDIMAASNEEGSVFNVSFNQNVSSLSIGSPTDLYFVSLSSPKSPQRVFNKSFPSGIRMVERLFTSSLVAFVTYQNLRTLRISNLIKGTEICSFAFRESVIAVRLNRARMVVCLERSLCIHNIHPMKPIHVIKDTAPNSKGVFALSPDENNSLLAFPVSSIEGHVEIFDTINLVTKHRFQAHELPISALAINSRGDLLSTASTKGTVIRIFNTLNGSRLVQFQRGYVPVDIYSIAFSMDSAFIVVSSSADTIDLFRVTNKNSDSNAQQQNSTPPSQHPTTETDDGMSSDNSNSWASWVKWAKVSVVPLIPTNWSEYLDRETTFLTIPNPSPGKRNVVALNQEESVADSEIVVHVCSEDGFLYNYAVKILSESSQDGGINSNNVLLSSQFRLEMKEASLLD